MLVLLSVKACLSSPSISSLHPGSPYWLNTLSLLLKWTAHPRMSQTAGGILNMPLEAAGPSWESFRTLCACLCVRFAFMISTHNAGFHPLCPVAWWIFMYRVALFCRASTRLRTFQNSLLLCLHVDRGNVWAHTAVLGSEIVYSQTSDTQIHPSARWWHCSSLSFG